MSDCEGKASSNSGSTESYDRLVLGVPADQKYTLKTVERKTKKSIISPNVSYAFVMQVK